jgi:glutathione S-transferase
MVTFLGKLRAAIAPSGFVVGKTFSYADIIAVTALQGIRPAKNEHWRIPTALRPAWTDELAPDYEDLLTWRDGILERYG